MSQAARYPENAMMFPPEYAANVPEHWRRFFELREELLLDYGYNTARAYWADLQDWFEWAIARDKDVLNLSDRDTRTYCALLRRRKYSENTIRRRLTSLRLLSRATKPNARSERDATLRCVRDSSPLQKGTPVRREL